MMFFPSCFSEFSSSCKKAAIQKMGLPYEPDLSVSVSSHLLYFLKCAYCVCEIKNSKDSKDFQILFPDKVLFNGWVMIPDVLRSRILEMLRNWFYNQNISELNSHDLSLAVPYGDLTMDRQR